jgi:hypothetical protein
VFTGLFDLKKPGEYPYLVVGEAGESDGLKRGRPPADRMRDEVSYGELPEGCRRAVLDVYRKLWGLGAG